MPDPWAGTGWAGRTVLVTGGGSGIGFATARALARAGARVVVAGRDPVRTARAVARLPGAEPAALDLADLDGVAAYAVPERLDALVCCAGVMGGVWLPSAQGHERQMATNHLGHAALVDRLWPALVAGSARVVAVTSIAARGGTLTAGTTAQELVDPQPYDGQAAYRRSKQANLLWAQELHRRLERTGTGVTCTAAHPGVAQTRLFAREQVDSGHPRLAPVVRAVGAVLLPSARSGARSVLQALAAPPGSFTGPRLGVLGRPGQLPVYACAADPAVARRLWEVTEEVLGHPLTPG